MKTIPQSTAFLFAMVLGFVACADDVAGPTARIRLIAGHAPEKGYIPRLEAVRALEKAPPLSDAERAALLAFLRATEATDGLTEMELAAVKNDVTERFLRLSADPKKEYRAWLEDYLKQGVEEKLFSKMASALVVGSARFKADVRRRVLKNTGGRTDRRLLPFSEVVGAVSEVKGEPWDDFVNRYGDPGRDLAVFVARRRCGLTLREVGGHAGMKDKAVSYACAAIGKRLEKDRELGLLYRRVLEKLGEAES